MAGQKRTRSGHPKAPQNTSSDPDTPMTDATPPCAQPLPLPPSSKTTSNPNASTLSPPTKSQQEQQQKQKEQQQHQHQHQKQQQQRPQHPPKMPKLPPTAILSKRPLLHTPLPSPFASASSPKIIYMTASTPYIPCLKRVRNLLAEISRRATQASGAAARAQRHCGAAEANGRLEARAVERDIAGAMRGRGSAAREQVFLKATGRAMVRALEIGVFFQAEGGFRVRVEMGSVRAVDDVEVAPGEGVQGGGGGDEEDVPETRIRTLSAVTVCIGMK